MFVHIGVSAKLFFFFQAEDGIRDLVRSRGLGDVYKRQILIEPRYGFDVSLVTRVYYMVVPNQIITQEQIQVCLLYTSDAADERSSVDLGGRRTIKKKKNNNNGVTSRRKKQQKRDKNYTKTDTKVETKRSNSRT